MKHLRISYSAAAKKDLKQLWIMYAAESEELADRILHRIALKIELLRKHPKLGRARRDLGRADLFSTAIRPHVIFYRIENRYEIMIDRIVDGRRNLAAVIAERDVN